MEWLFDPQIWASLVTLTALEIILGVDNVIFIALLVQALPKDQRMRARTIGLSLAMIMRITFLLGLAWLIRLTKPLLTVLTWEFSGRDLVLLSGGLFLLIQSTLNIHESVVGTKKQELKTNISGFINVVAQIIVIDFVFSLDSVITAVGITLNIPVIIAAMVIAMIVMLLSAKIASDFIERFPTLRMLALSFILMIGTLLIAEGFHFHLPRAYVYFAMLFSVFVETLNLVSAERQKKRENSGEG